MLVLVANPVCLPLSSSVGIAHLPTIMSHHAHTHPAMYDGNHTVYLWWESCTCMMGIMHTCSLHIMHTHPAHLACKVPHLAHSTTLVIFFTSACSATEQQPAKMQVRTAACQQFGQRSRLWYLWRSGALVFLHFLHYSLLLQSVTIRSHFKNARYAYQHVAFYIKYDQHLYLLVLWTWFHGAWGVNVWWGKVAGWLLGFRELDLQAVRHLQNCLVPKLINVLQDGIKSLSLDALWICIVCVCVVKSYRTKIVLCCRMGHGALLLRLFGFDPRTF